MNTHSKQAKGFTLVELLVVIAIIAVLAALSTPVIMKALTKAKITTAKNVCVAVENAVDRFEDDYSYMPYDPSEAVPDGDTPASTPIRSDSDLMSVLVGVEDVVNYKKIKYFSLSEAKGTSEDNYKDGLAISGTTAKLYDAWGEAYYMLLDYDLDGTIENPFEAGSDNAVHGKKLLIFSTGPEGPENGKPGDGATNKELKQIPSNFIK